MRACLPRPLPLSPLSSQSAFLFLPSRSSALPVLPPSRPLSPGPSPLSPRLFYPRLFSPPPTYVHTRPTPVVRAVEAPFHNSTVSISGLTTAHPSVLHTTHIHTHTLHTYPPCLPPRPHKPQKNADTPRETMPRRSFTSASAGRMEIPHSVHDIALQLRNEADPHKGDAQMA
jgi:hypothetical protein